MNPILHAGLSLAAGIATSIPAAARPTPTYRLQAADTDVTVSGVVFDSTEAAPLVGARVVLWGTSHQAFTDSAGAFTLPHVPPGAYTATFFHPRLGELGVSAPAHALRVESKAIVLELAVPSLFTLETAQCTGEPGVATAGRVYDRDSQLSLAGVPITFRWTDAAGGAHAASASSGAGGWYQVCGLPTATPVAVDATFLDHRSPRSEIEAPAGSAVRLDLPLATRTPSRVSASVRQAETGRPVEGAVVTLGLSGEGRVALSDQGGRAVFDGVPPGRYTFQVEHLVYGKRRGRVDVPDGSRVSLAVDVTPRPIPLPPLDVSVERIAPSPVAVKMGGIQIGPEQIRKVLPRSTTLSDVLNAQHVSGLVVRRDTGDGLPCVEFVQGTVALLPKVCQPVMVLVDGARVSNPQSVFLMSATVIERMQLFRPVDAGDLFGLGASRGVLVVTTRH